MDKEKLRTISFDELLTGFILFLKQEKWYNQNTLKHYYNVIYKIKSFLQFNGVAYYTPEIGLRYYDMYIVEHNIGISYQRVIFTYINRFNDFYSGVDYVIQHKKSFELLPKHFEKVLKLYIVKCYEIGNKEITVNSKTKCIRKFLKDCICLECNKIRDLNSTHITKACLKIKNKDTWAIIRGFLKWLAVNDIIETDLSTLIPHYKHPFNVPITYSIEEIAKFEKIIDRSTDIGKRDYAMILMATRLGMRSGDIVNFTFDNIDFESEKLSFFQQKTGEAIVLPLIPEIKNALVDYISNGRPKTLGQIIFIRHVAPYQGITTSVLRFVTTKYFKAAGINIIGKKHGPHTFRSSLVTSMVNDSIPYESVRKILGHSTSKTINHYAKLDIKMLRQCAIEVPKPTGKFKEFLKGGESL